MLPYPRTMFITQEGTASFPQPNSALLSFPYEIRHKIWEYVLPGGDFYCCKDYGHCHERVKPENMVLIESRDKTNNCSNSKFHQACLWRTRLGRPDNRLIILNRQTYEDTKDIISKIPLHLIFGNVQCLVDFESTLPAHRKRQVKHFSVRTSFHCPSYSKAFKDNVIKGTAKLAGKKNQRQGRALERIVGKATIWQKHAQNRVQCITKKFAGHLDPTTYDTYPRIKTLRDRLNVWEYTATVTVTLEKQLMYPDEKLLHLDEAEERKIDESDTPFKYLTFDSTMEEGWLERLMAGAGEHVVDPDVWAAGLTAEALVAAGREQEAGGNAGSTV